MGTLDERYYRAVYLASLITPKLEGLNNSGDGATIHESGHYLSIIYSTERNIKYYKEHGDLTKYEDMVKMLEKFIIDAENWMIRTAKQ